MLRVEVASATIAAVQEAYVARGTFQSARTARQIMMLRTAFERAADRFNQRQQHASGRGRAGFADGRRATLADTVFGPLASDSWPSRAAGLLHGLHLRTAEHLPDLPARPGGRLLREIDPHSYVARLDDGPPQARAFGEMTAVLLYIDPFKLMRIMWIGLEIDVAEALASLAYVSGGLVDWSAVHPRFDQWLRNQS